MISKERQSEILRLYHAEKWRVGTIAVELGIHHSAVRRVIAQENAVMGLRNNPRMADVYLPFINETLARHPRLTAIRLYGMCQARGYPGKISQFRAVISELRKPRPSEAFFRLKSLPGEQAQVDWAHFGQLECGNALRPLMGFVMALSHSRAVFLHFFLSQNLSNFLYGHQLAFEWFGGVPRVCLYDNLKSVVLERSGTLIRFNQKFMACAGHYRFEPCPVAVARGNEKGRVERAIRYIRSNFFEARRFTDIADLNAQAQQWCDTTSLLRHWQDNPTKTVKEVFIEEKKLLIALPETLFPCDERREVSIGKTPYARFDLNDYSVPITHVQKSVCIQASTDKVRIIDGFTVIAEHQRCYARGEQVEKPAHLEELKQIKTQATEARNRDVLTTLAPSSVALLKQAAERNFPLRQITALLTSLLKIYGAVALESALAEAITKNTPHPHAVQNILERARLAQGKPAALPLPIPEDPRLKDFTVTPHSLSSYDNLTGEKKDPNDQ